MAKEFKMPMVAESVVEGEVGKWFVKEGDFVKMDQPLLEVLTDKVNVEIPSPIEGTLSRIVVPEGKIAQVGEVLAIFAEAIETEAAVRDKEPEPEETESKKKEPESKPKGPKPLATPAVRRKAREMGIDLLNVEGTGPGGRITEADLEKQKKTQPSVEAPKKSTWPPPPPVESKILEEPPPEPEIPFKYLKKSRL